MKRSIGEDDEEALFAQRGPFPAGGKYACLCADQLDDSGQRVGPGKRRPKLRGG